MGTAGTADALAISTENRHEDAEKYDAERHDRGYLFGQYPALESSAEVVNEGWGLGEDPRYAED